MNILHSRAYQLRFLITVLKQHIDALNALKVILILLGKNT